VASALGIRGEDMDGITYDVYHDVWIARDELVHPIRMSSFSVSSNLPLSEFYERMFDSFRDLTDDLTEA